MEIDKAKLEALKKKMENGRIASVNMVSVFEVYDKAIKELEALINPKWEPKEYDDYFYINGNGWIDNYNNPDDVVILYGGCFKTKELAETARDMNKRNQLILQAKTEMGYGDGGYTIALESDTKEWTTICREYYFNDPELTFETKGQAETVIKMVGLNE